LGEPASFSPHGHQHCSCFDSGRLCGPSRKPIALFGAMMSHFSPMPSASPKTMNRPISVWGRRTKWKGGRPIRPVRISHRPELNPYRVKTYSNLAICSPTPVKPTKRSPNFERLCGCIPKTRCHTTPSPICSPTRPYQRSARRISRGSADKSKDAALHDNLGAMLVELGRFDEAREHYAAAARLDPADWPRHYLVGKALLNKARLSLRISGRRCKSIRIISMS